MMRRAPNTMQWTKVNGVSLHVCQTMLMTKHHLTLSVDDIMDSKQVNDCRDTLITAGRTYTAYR